MSKTQSIIEQLRQERDKAKTHQETKASGGNDSYLKIAIGGEISLRLVVDPSNPDIPFRLAGLSGFDATAGDITGNKSWKSLGCVPIDPNTGEYIDDFITKLFWSKYNEVIKPIKNETVRKTQNRILAQMQLVPYAFIRVLVTSHNNKPELVGSQKILRASAKKNREGIYTGNIWKALQDNINSYLDDPDSVDDVFDTVSGPTLVIKCTSKEMEGGKKIPEYNVSFKKARKIDVDAASLKAVFAEKLDLDAALGESKTHEEIMETLTTHNRFFVTRAEDDTREHDNTEEPRQVAPPRPAPKNIVVDDDSDDIFASD